MKKGSQGQEGDGAATRDGNGEGGEERQGHQEARRIIKEWGEGSERRVCTRCRIEKRARPSCEILRMKKWKIGW